MFHCITAGLAVELPKQLTLILLSAMNIWLYLLITLPYCVHTCVCEEGPVSTRACARLVVALQAIYALAAAGRAASVDLPSAAQCSLESCCQDSSRLCRARAWLPAALAFDQVVMRHTCSLLKHLWIGLTQPCTTHSNVCHAMLWAHEQQAQTGPASLQLQRC